MLNETQQNAILAITILSITTVDSGCCYVDCRYSECRGAPGTTLGAGTIKKFTCMAIVGGKAD